MRIPSPPSAEPAGDLRLVLLVFAGLLAAALPLFFLAKRARPTSALVARGHTIFAQRCAVCHSTGDDGGQGPGLAGVVGRRAGTAPRFGYSRPLRASGLVWDGPTLQQFLAAPGQLVPGTTMGAAVPNPGERGALIVYLATLPSMASMPSRAPSSRPAVLAPVAGDAVRVGAAAFGDYRSDAPGVRRRIGPQDLPPPFATPSSSNGPTLVDCPEGAVPRVPAGFAVDLFARDLENPRLVRVAPNGDVFVAETSAGRVRLLRAASGAPKAERVGGLRRRPRRALRPRLLSAAWRATVALRRQQ